MCFVQELEGQLKSAAEERTQFQSKFHELSIKHRQLIETSPQVASIWNEVVVQSGGDADQETINRMSNFDLRHAKNSGPYSGGYNGKMLN
jgi:hypothetical protein